MGKNQKLIFFIPDANLTSIKFRIGTEEGYQVGATVEKRPLHRKTSSPDFIHARIKTTKF